ncbi:hypothetical protein CBLAS_0909 [Campylobacter blaseri]|uniref:Uncharacterized protein n=1 Tax=Campylobacter blaseri TaxID=2042961 RepID=A0A2P8QYA0_9BACT|nr:hypothetical protein [Campylobacter blaseri]PSM51215.1 hypothetical protein CQ405_09265 [Campylobacter blaseri]PSM52097.1 hypothetical protein CRN67_09285 [Campylobacter blaseri]QKF85573.1 hypothetical protein CBLAS_0369 [Campylobacter blaseri]QKF86094.1 hypothetical protein CBLAS_0909 [Campylobacter blaseri]
MSVDFDKMVKLEETKDFLDGATALLYSMAIYAKDGDNDRIVSGLLFLGDGFSSMVEELEELLKD